MNNQKPIGVMFVCAGNICRSPMAEAVFRHLVQEAGLSARFEIASSGTGGWHAGEQSHPGTQAVLQRNGIMLGDKRAQQLTSADLDHYQYIIVADEENMHDIHVRRETVSGHLHRLLEFAPHTDVINVPDPYYTGNFDRVYDLVYKGCTGLLSHIRRQEQF